MKQTTFQHPEIRDANDNIIQEGTYGKASPLVNSDNTGVLDYINNNLMYLYNNTMGGTGGEINTETIAGKTGTITNLTATTVKAGTLTADALNGPLTGNVTGTADKAIADGNGNNIVNTYVTKSALASSVTTATGKVTTLTATDSTLTNLTVTGQTTAPTPDATDNSTKIATTEFVNAKAGNYLPLKGGTMRGTITTTANPVLKVRNNDSYLVLCGASSYEHGAHMLLNGKDRPYNEGTFGIVANDGSGDRVMLIGKPDGTLTWNDQPLLPVGVVQAFAGSTIPTGWLLCDGSAVSRTTYANLYACIGTTYGTGNGSTTFNLPNLTDKFIQGSATAGTVKSAGLPNITGGSASIMWKDYVANNGAYVFREDVDGRKLDINSGSGGWDYFISSFDASRSSSVYGNSSTVQPPALTMRYIIKY